MKIISEEQAKTLVSIEEAIEVVEEAFLALASGDAKLFPVVPAHGFDEAERWAVKSGLDRRNGAIGFKVGSYWPGNKDRGISPHASTVVLMNPETGFAEALVGASHLTTLRTAAADAVAVKHLSRADAKTVTVIGAGHQALWDVRAIAAIRQLSLVLVASRSRENASIFVDRLSELGIRAEVANVDEAVAAADIIVTATPSSAALFAGGAVRAGTHISAMGADSNGKQELPHDLIVRARLYCDIVGQSTTIGEFQSGVRAGLVDPAAITPLGDVIAGKACAPLANEISIFDSSGTALQDLAICALALRKLV